jgi:hypothetical protein
MPYEHAGTPPGVPPSEPAHCKSPGAQTALNTQRYLTVLSATNRSACQCKNGAHSAVMPDSRRRLLCCNRLFPSDGQGWGGTCAAPVCRTLICAVPVHGRSFMQQRRFSIELFRSSAPEKRPLSPIEDTAASSVLLTFRLCMQPCEKCPTGATCDGAVALP